MAAPRRLPVVPGRHVSAPLGALADAIRRQDAPAAARARSELGKYGYALVRTPGNVPSRLDELREAQGLTG